jgi:hypothetical protein
MGATPRPSVKRWIGEFFAVVAHKIHRLAETPSNCGRAFRLRRHADLDLEVKVVFFRCGELCTSREQIASRPRQKRHSFREAKLKQKLNTNAIRANLPLYLSWWRGVRRQRVLCSEKMTSDWEWSFGTVKQQPVEDYSNSHPVGNQRKESKNRNLKKRKWKFCTFSPKFAQKKKNVAHKSFARPRKLNFIASQARIWAVHLISWRLESEFHVFFEFVVFSRFRCSDRRSVCLNAKHKVASSDKNKFFGVESWRYPDVHEVIFQFFDSKLTERPQGLQSSLNERHK